MKETIFLKIINDLKEQDRKDTKFHKAAGKCCLMGNGFYYDYSLVLNSLLLLLKEIFNDDSGWIEYYIYELDYGKKYKEGCVTQNKKNIPLATPKDLYNLLKSNQNERR